MSAEPLPEWGAVPEWLYPPTGGWTADDLDRLPPGAPRFELIDGALIMMSPQTRFHNRVIRRLADAMEAAAPSDMSVDIEMTIKLGRRQRPEPDILVLNVPATEGATRTWFRPDEVVLVVEIVSDESEERDRVAKPVKYAKAGIRHFWRVEKEADEPAVYVYELDAVTDAYVPTGIHRQQLKVSVPFPMDIDLTKLSDR